MTQKVVLPLRLPRLEITVDRKMNFPAMQKHLLDTFYIFFVVAVFYSVALAPSWATENSTKPLRKQATIKEAIPQNVVKEVISPKIINKPESMPVKNHGG